MRYHVELEQLDEVISQIASFQGRLSDRLDEVETQVRMLHGTWRGVAADEHEAVHRRWMQSQRDMHEALGVLRQIAATAHSNYSQTQTANRSMWDAL